MEVELLGKLGSLELPVELRDLFEELKSEDRLASFIGLRLWLLLFHIVVCQSDSKVSISLPI